jgi:Protein of unknown function (DUF429)
MPDYIGIDGCRGGWIAVGLSRSESWIVSVFADIGELWLALQGANLFLIDIPIGLCEGEYKSRACDTVARRLLGFPRASSVFTPPARPSLEFDNREKASRKNYSLTGRKIGVQSWGISGKIKQVDRFLRSNSEARKIIRETHPELLFCSGKGVRPILIDIIPQPLICRNHAKKYSPHYPQYMPSCHTAWKQPPGRIPGKRRSVLLSQVGQKISRAVNGKGNSYHLTKRRNSNDHIYSETHD